MSRPLDYACGQRRTEALQGDRNCDGKWWMIRIPELEELTQARRLSEVETMARELIAVTLDIPFSKAQVTIDGIDVAGVNVSQRVGQLAAKRRRLETAERSVGESQIALARELAAHEVPVRDIGTALGVSFQRAQQLVSS